MEMNFEYIEPGHLFINRNDEREEVELTPCFPYSNQDKFLSVQNLKGKEIFILEDIEQLDIASHEAVKKKIDLANFKFFIRKINSINEEVELRKYNIETKDGVRSFYTSLEEWPSFQNGKVSIEDLSGDVYHIGDVGKLDKKSKELLNPYIR